MTIFDDLTEDLNWRESELGSLKILLTGKNLSRTQKTTLLRAAWALLYAHYEGFSKFCLTRFYDEASRRLSNCSALPQKTLAFAVSSQIKRLRLLPPLEMIIAINSFPRSIAATKPAFPDVETKSNLWPNVMQQLLEDADIVVECVDEHSSKIKTLVRRRNEIAHGNRNFIDEVEYYLTYEHAVYEVMYELALAVDDRLSKPPY